VSAGHDEAVRRVEEYLARPSWARSPYLGTQAREIVDAVLAATAAERGTAVHAELEAELLSAAPAVPFVGRPDDH
jgi:mRNA-degrading endonuclease toxin of MazEF toxin-antitoxin module